MKALINRIRNNRKTKGLYINGIFVSEYSAWQDSLERELAKAQYSYKIF